MELQPEVMQRFLAGFQAGSGAAATSARTSQGAADFVLRSQQLEQQKTAQERELIQNQTKINAQREANSMEAALGSQKINLDAQKAAMQYKLQEQQGQLERLAFVERLKSQKAIADQNRLEMQMRLDQLEKQNSFKAQELEQQKTNSDKMFDYRKLQSEQRAGQRTEDQQMKMELRSKSVLQDQMNQALKIAGDPANPIRAQLLDANGQPDQQKMYDFASANSRRILDSTGMSKPSLPSREQLAEEKKVDTTGNSQQSPKATPKPKGVIENFVDKQALEWAQNHPDDARAKLIKKRLGVE